MEHIVSIKDSIIDFLADVWLFMRAVPLIAAQLLGVPPAMLIVFAASMGMLGVGVWSLVASLSAAVG